MDINPAQASPHQTVALKKREHFVVTGYRRMRKRGEGAQQLVSLREVSTRQLPDDEGMGPNLSLFEQRDQRGVASTQVIDPDGRIDQHFC